LPTIPKLQLRRLSNTEYILLVIAVVVFQTLARTSATSDEARTAAAGRAKRRPVIVVIAIITVVTRSRPMLARSCRFIRASHAVPFGYSTTKQFSTVSIVSRLQSAGRTLLIAYVIITHQTLLTSTILFSTGKNAVSYRNFVTFVFL